jgi:hypothetical protein
MKHTWIPKTLAFALLIAVSKTLPATPTWVPPGSTAAPLTVKYAVYDLRNSSTSDIQFRLSDGNDYFFYFSPSDPLQSARASVIMSVLLTAKSTGEGVYVYLPDNTVRTIAAVQIGPN